MWIGVGSTNDLKPESLLCLSRTEKMITSPRFISGSFSVPSRPSKRLETFANPTPQRDYRIHMEIPEFTCLCPKTGQPDFATLVLGYVPDRLCVELKSLKLYVWSYRDEGAFHEAVTNRILDDLVRATRPRYMKLEARFNVRGGIYTSVIAAHRKKGWRRQSAARETQPPPVLEAAGADGCQAGRDQSLDRRAEAPDPAADQGSTRRQPRRTVDLPADARHTRAARGDRGLAG